VLQNSQLTDSDTKQSLQQAQLKSSNIMLLAGEYGTAQTLANLEEERGE